MNYKYGILFIGSVIAVFLMGIMGVRYQSTGDLAKRQEMIHKRGSLVMPFDLTRTTHRFSPTTTGGVQQVKAKDSGDKAQIELIRLHLKEEAQRFARGDFGDPKILHGERMPGLDVLSRSQGKFTIAYVDLQDGVELTYTASDPKIIQAFHDWFAAQLMDHGVDAIGH